MRRDEVVFIGGFDGQLPAPLKHGDRVTVCRCGACGVGFAARRRRRWCSDACRKRAQREKAEAKA